MTNWYFTGALRLSDNPNTLGIPIYVNRTDNHAYIPQTDRFLVIDDFLQVDDNEYSSIDYLCGLEFHRTISGIGFPTVVPFWIDNQSTAFLSSVEASELNAIYPVPLEGIDILQSIRSLIKSRANPSEELGSTFEDLPSQNVTDLLITPPSNTKNWLNRFKIVAGRTPNSLSLSDQDLTSVRLLAIKWLREWYLKGSFDLSLELLGSGGTGYLSRSEVEHIVFLQYVERSIRKHGKPILQKEARTAYRRFFKNGLVGYLIRQYRPSLHTSLLEDVGAKIIHFDELKNTLEDSYKKNVRAFLRNYQYEDALLLTIQFYGDDNIPSDVLAQTGILLAKTEAEFYSGLTRLRFNTDRSVQGHVGMFQLATKLAATGRDIETLFRITKPVSRVAGDHRRRIDEESIADLKRFAERHYILSQATEAGPMRSPPDPSQLEAG